jgi:hypothetical protein
MNVCVIITTAMLTLLMNIGLHGIIGTMSIFIWFHATSATQRPDTAA